MPITDDFNRGSLGSTWAQIVGSTAPTIVSNQLTPGGATFTTTIIWRAETLFPNDHYAQLDSSFTTGGNSSFWSPAVRIQSNGECYYAVPDTTNISLFRRNSAGTGVYITDVPITASASTLYPIKIEATGASPSTLKVWFNGSLAINTTDGSGPQSGGRPGIRWGGNSDQPVADNFESTDATAIAPPIYASFINAGSPAVGTGTVTPEVPTTQAGDALILVVQSANESISLSDAQGFVVVPNSTYGTGTGGASGAVGVTVYAKRATGSDVAPTIDDAGDHAFARIYNFRYVGGGANFVNVAGGDTASSSASVTIPAITTLIDNSIVVVIVANATDKTANFQPLSTWLYRSRLGAQRRLSFLLPEFAANNKDTARESVWTDWFFRFPDSAKQGTGFSNASLSEIINLPGLQDTTGVGGGFDGIYGLDVTAGSTGTTSATLGFASAQARVILAIVPDIYPAEFLLSMQCKPLLRM